MQDYVTEWIKIIKQNFLIEQDEEFIVFGDPKQNVYGRTLDNNGDIRLGVIGGQWNRQLTTSRRFKNSRLANLAIAFQAQFMSNQTIDTITIDNVAEGNLFQNLEYIDMRTRYSLEGLVDNIINIISKDNNNPEDFTVLASTTKLLRDIESYYRERTNEKTETTFISTEVLEKLKKLHNNTDKEWMFQKDLDALERTRKRLFTTDKRYLKLSTIQSFKGWDSASVIVILEQSVIQNDSKISPTSPHAVIYTAITRAKEQLYIINIGNDSYHDFFKKIIQKENISPN